MTRDQAHALLDAHISGAIPVMSPNEMIEALIATGDLRRRAPGQIQPAPAPAAPIEQTAVTQ